MSKVRVSNFSISLDGYGAGPDQSLDEPLGIGGESLHEWMLATRTGRRDVLGMDGGETGLDDDFAARGHDGIGATIMGRNMFGPIRGPWGDEEWTGWWGDDRRTTTPRTCSPTTPIRPSRCRAARRSTSSTAASRRRSSKRGRPRVAKTS